MKVQQQIKDGEIGSAFLNEMPTNRAVLAWLAFFAFVKGTINQSLGE
jgi:hypothetical protein